MPSPVSRIEIERAAIHDIRHVNMPADNTQKPTFQRQRHDLVLECRGVLVDQYPEIFA